MCIFGTTNLFSCIEYIQRKHNFSVIFGHKVYLIIRRVMQSKLF